jgi:hypothetical protein
MPTWERLDVLALDRTGRLIVAELKRDVAPDTVVVQALNYAAMVSRFNLDLLIEAYGARRMVSCPRSGFRRSCDSGRRPSSMRGERLGGRRQSAGSGFRSLRVPDSSKRVPAVVPWPYP